VLNELLNAKRPVAVEYALFSEAVLDVESVMFVRMQARYDMQVARKGKCFSARLAKARSMAAALP
jgi:plasmid maintenance system antidote protein VapI